MVIRFGSRRVLGATHGDLLEIEIALDADGRAWPDDEWVELFREYMLVPRDQAGQQGEKVRRENVDRRLREAQQLLDSLD